MISMKVNSQSFKFTQKIQSRQGRKCFIFIICILGSFQTKSVVTELRIMILTISHNENTAPFSKFYKQLMDKVGEGNGNPLQYSCLENPMDGGAWQATVHGVAKSQTRMGNFTHHTMDKTGQVDRDCPVTTVVKSLALL